MSTIIYPSPIFGPVHSRRLGVSLGINLMPGDGKVCTFDCVYCECGFNADHRARLRRPTREEVRAALDAFAAEGYTAGFMLYDLNSGGGISYHADEMYYSASAIKGPYVAWLAECYPQALDSLYGTIQNTITWSDNDAYGELIALYGSTEFNAWAAEIGCEELVISGGWYASVNARDFAKLWCHMYDRVVAGESLADIINIYTDTLSSAISETLGGQYTVYSKGGWIGEGKGSYYNVQNDAGIVMKGEHPYVLVILSDAYGRLDLLDNLVYVLDQAHTALAGTAG